MEPRATLSGILGYPLWRFGVGSIKTKETLSGDYREALRRLEVGSPTDWILSVIPTQRVGSAKPPVRIRASPSRDPVKGIRRGVYPLQEATHY